MCNDKAWNDVICSLNEDLHEIYLLNINKFISETYFLSMKRFQKAANKLEVLKTIY